MEYLISQYIDDELDFDEKIEFVRIVHADSAYKDEAIELLSQEKLLREMLCSKTPRTLPLRHRFNFYRPTRLVTGWSGWAVAALLLVLLLGPIPHHPARVELTDVASTNLARQHRFVIFKPGITSAEITGSFTDWRKIPLQPAVTDGYWEVTLKVAPGEHRFIYILDGKTLFPDPTLQEKEIDDFGARNSILRVEV